MIRELLQMVLHGNGPCRKKDAGTSEARQMKAAECLFQAVLLLCTVFSSSSLTGCMKDDADMATVFGGPSDVMLIVDGDAATKALTRAGYAVDEDGVVVETVRIYAFKHAPGEAQDGERVGYGYFTGLSLESGGTSYCRMSLSASGKIDFYVLANDGYAAGFAVNGGTVTDLEGLGRDDLNAMTFTGLKAGATAIPMSNIPSGTEVDDNNLTYTVQESPQGNGLPQLIPIDITRAMARLSFHFAKSPDSPDIVIEGIELKARGPGNAKFFSETGAPDGYSDVQNTVTLLDPDSSGDDITVTKLNSSGSLDEDDLEEIDGAGTYLLPNAYGSSDPDTQPSGENGTFGYVLTVTYRATGQAQSKAKDIYLPSVRPNEWLQVKGIFNTPVDVSMVVIALYWDESNNSITFN